MTTSLYFDIETSGLDPFKDTLRAVGFLVEDTFNIMTAVTTSQERFLLEETIAVLNDVPRIGGWNITEFDLNFLNVRAGIHGLDRTLNLSPILDGTGQRMSGKYGGVRYELTDNDVYDMAYAPGRLPHVGLHGQAQLYGWSPSVTISSDEFTKVSLAKLTQHLLDDLEAIRVVRDNER